MKKYMRYLLKNLWLETLIISFLTIIVSLSFIYMGRSSYMYFHYMTQVWGYRSPEGVAFMIFIPVMIASFVVICLRAHQLKSRAYIDMVYSLPLERKKLIGSHLLIGLLQTIVIFTLVFVSGVFLFNGLSFYAFNQSYIWLSYPVMLFHLIILYGLFQFFVYRANNIFDAVVFNGVSLLILLLVVIYIQVVTPSNIYYPEVIVDTFDEWSILPFYSMGNVMTYLWESSRPIDGLFIFKEMNEMTRTHAIVSGTIYILLSGFCYFYSVLKFRTDKIEKIGDISTSPFGYMIQLPMLITITAAIFGYFALRSTNNDNFSFLPIIAIGGLISCYIYRRTIKIPWIDYVMVTSSIVLGMLISFIVWI